MQKYISINNDTKSTRKEIHLKNPNNELCGVVKTVNPKTDELEDVRDLFISSVRFEDIDPIEINDSGKGFTLEDIALKLNEILCMLKKHSENQTNQTRQPNGNNTTECECDCGSWN